MANTGVAKRNNRELQTTEQLSSSVTYTPRVDIVETEEETLLYADLPGVRPDDLDVQFENGELAIRGKCAPRHGGGTLLFSEYGVGDFYRAFGIAQEVDASRISAELKNGVLTLRLPKSEAVKPKRIEVKSE